MAQTGHPVRSRWRRMLGSAWFHLIAAFVVVGLILSLVAKPYWVPSGSMETTLTPGDRILVNRLAYVGAGPETGDIVVFDADSTWDADTSKSENPIRGALRWLGEATGFGPSSSHTLVKRVIAGPGQSAACCTDDGVVIVDGIPIDEPYVTHNIPFALGALDCTTSPRSLRCFDEVTVPAGAYLVLGDNRAGSSDSAAHCRADPVDGCWRWAMRPGIVGKAVVLLWPVARWAGL